MNKRIFISSALCGLAVIMGGCTTNNASTQNNINVVNNNTTVMPAAGKQYNGPKFDVDAVVKKMKRRAMMTGVSQAEGVWVVYRIDIPADSKTSKDQMLSLAEIRAKRDIAAWMNSSVKSESSLERSQVIEGDKSVLKEVYKSLTQTTSEAFLRGVTLHSSYTDNKGFHAFFYATGKIADRTAELEAQLKAAPPGVVRATGLGMIVNGKLTAAKREARKMALQAAVEQVMGTMVIGQSQLMDNDKAKSKLISQTAGNVREYRIVKEEKDGANYIMIINAKVDEKNLLDNYAAMVRSMGNPGFMVKCQDPDLKAAFSGFLAELGFKVVNQPSEAAFIVDGNCKYIAANHDYYGKGIQIDLNLRLLDKKSGQEFFNISNDPRFTTSFSGSLHQIRQSSAKKAFNKMREELHKKLNKVVMDWVLNGREVKVTFKNAANTALDEVLAQAIADVPCAKFMTRSRNGNTLVLHCSYVGPSADFEEFLRERMKKDLPNGTALPKTKKIELNYLEFSF